MCTFRNDAFGINYDELVTKDVASTCKWCKCKQLYAKCLFGPDSLGNLVESEKNYSFAEGCDRSFCVCTTHKDYKKVWRQRIAESVDLVEVAKVDIERTVN